MIDHPPKTPAAFPMWASEDVRERAVRRLRDEYRPCKHRHGDIPPFAIWVKHPTRDGWYVADYPPMGTELVRTGDSLVARWPVTVQGKMSIGRVHGGVIA